MKFFMGGKVASFFPYKISKCSLVGGLEPWNFMTFHILGISSSQLTKSYFSEEFYDFQ